MFDFPPSGNSKTFDVDVCIITNLRFPGGNASSTLNEVEIFGKAGLKVLVVHLPLAAAEGISLKYQPVLDLLVHYQDVQQIACKVVIVRSPRVILKKRFLNFAPRLVPQRAIFIVNNSHRRPNGESMFEYDELVNRIERLPWRRKQIYPAGPAIRSEMQASGVDSLLNSADWSPTLDDSQIAFLPKREMTVPFVIGRHGRDGSEKWIESREQLLAAYPDDAAFKINILGGADSARRILGRNLPKNWSVIPFGGMAPFDYLNELDAFVYFPHTRLNEAFGRTIAEAMFSGVPCILPFEFRKTFQSLAFYGKPQDIPMIVRRLAVDDAGRLAFLAEVRKQVELFFGASALKRRLPEFFNVPHGNGEITLSEAALAFQKRVTSAE